MDANIAPKFFLRRSTTIKQETIPPVTNPNHLSPSADPRPYVYTALRRKTTKARRSERKEEGEPVRRLNLFQEPISDTSSAIHEGSESSVDATDTYLPAHKPSPEARKHLSPGKMNEILALQDEIIATKEKIVEATQTECKARVTTLEEIKAAADLLIAQLTKELREERTAFAEFREQSEAARERSWKVLEELRGAHEETLRVLRKRDEVDGLWREVGRFAVNMVKVVLMLGILAVALMALVFGLLRVGKVFFRWLVS
ncbi:MAG: hypothetical protein LQ343_007703 [Gyalolechia ehrenbergii]|nr:MAG: hypothetical protein LQ343_007703 [Gyalolechia ehrenbergii]